MMREAILDFAKQFDFIPRIQGTLKNYKPKQVIISAIGGSLLAGRLVKAACPNIDVFLHGDYGLPQLPPEKLKDSLWLIVSYSGNTEEPIDTFNLARKKGYNLIAIATGGRLLELAKEYKVPYIKIPDTGIQPRMALGFNFRAILKAVDEEVCFRQSTFLSKILNPELWSAEGKRLAKKLANVVPVIYSSTRNQAVAYSWKIKLNETGKIPAFYNVLPEMNHNEMTGFDAQADTKKLSKPFFFIFLKDDEDHPRILARMETLQKLYHDRKLPVEVVTMKGSSRLEKIFSSILLADWTACYLAGYYKVEAEQVPMVENFKKLIKHG